VSEPIEHCGELDETEESDGQLLVTSGNSTVAFDSGEVVFDRVSMLVETAVSSSVSFEFAASCAIFARPI
jgi:hypothetical protein